METRRTCRTTSRTAFLFCLSLLMVPGCQTSRGTGALAGGGVGALIGGAAGGWQGAAIGGAIGIGTGYIIGNEVDKAKAESYSAVPAEELRPFSGTRWELTELQTATPGPAYDRVTIDFGRGGTLVTRKTRDGRTTETFESYRVVGGVLIVNKPGYIINARYSLTGDTLHLSDTNLRKAATFRRI